MMIAPNFTLRRLIGLLGQHYGVTVECFDVPDESGRMISVRTLVRESTGYWFAPIGPLQDESMLTTDVVRSICAQLGVPTLEFGMPLEWEDN